MNEKTLTKVSVFGVIISMIILYFITLSTFTNHINIGEIDETFVGETVNITGEIVSVFRNNDNIFTNIQDDTGEIKIVLWEDTLETIRLNGQDTGKIERGNLMNVVGEVQVYKGILEVIPVRGHVKII